MLAVLLLRTTPMCKLLLSSQLRAPAMVHVHVYPSVGTSETTRPPKAMVSQRSLKDVPGKGQIWKNLGCTFKELETVTRG